MLKKTNPLLAQIAMNPLLVDENAEELFQSSLQHVVTHEHAEAFVNTAQMNTDDEDFWFDDDDWRAEYRPYTVINGILQIPVMGVLLSRFPWQLGRWATGYKYIEMCFRRGLEDYNVKGFALIEDSPGGEVTECFELTDKIYGWRGEKPIRAYAANHAYSAAFSIYSAADNGQRVVTRSGGVGSIGVVTAHVEFSDYLKEAGIKVTFIFAGKHKVDGNPYEKLSASAKARTQARIDKIYGVFTSTVARNTGIDEDKIRATEALTYDADEAIEVGLSDRIGALEEELVVYATELAETGDEFMAQANVTGKKPEGGDEATGYSQEQVDAMVATAKAEGMKEGAAAEHARMSGILGHEAAKDKPKAAAKLAINKSRMSIEDAADLLADYPVEKATAPEATNQNGGKPQARDHFAEAMNGTQHPNIGADGGQDEEVDANSPQAQSNAILAAYGAAAGITRKKTA